MRDIIILSIFVVALVFAIRNPLVGLLLYFWISIMNPHRYSWGFAYDFPLAQVAALVTLLGCVLKFNELKLPKIRETYLFFLFWIFITITTFFSLYPFAAWETWKTVSKIFMMTTLTMLIVTDRQKLFYFFLAITCYVGLLGVKGGVFGVLTGGQFSVIGPPASFLADNNNMGLALVMIIPFAFLMKDFFAKKIFTFFMIGMGLAAIVSAILTYSRGTFLGLAILGFFGFVYSRNRFAIALALLLVLGIGINFLPEKWFDRMATIETYEQDRSANQRINSWIFSYRIGSTYALGGGFSCFTNEQYRIHAPVQDLSSGLTAHSIYFQVLAEHGFGGLAIYLLCLISLLLSLRKLKRISRVFPNADWISTYSRAITISVLAFMVSGAFLSRAYFDLFWAIYAGAVSLVYIVLSGNWIELPSGSDELIQKSAGARIEPAPIR